MTQTAVAGLLRFGSRTTALQSRPLSQSRPTPRRGTECHSPLVTLVLTAFRRSRSDLRLGHFGEIKVTIGAMSNYRLPRLKTELDAIEIYGNEIRLERHKVGDAADF